MRQVLDLSEAPVIFSHSSARALVDHRRNAPDDVLARMARNGGVVMVTFIPAFVSAETAAWGKGLETSIFNAKTSAEMERLEKEHVALHGPAPLIRRGWSDSDLEKLAAGNVLRALRGAEGVARRLATTRSPSTAVIERLDRRP
jgi:membrane dipeptidase